MPILLQVKITIPSSELDRFFEFFQPAYDAVIAEPENSFFEVSVDKKDVAENGKVYIHLVEGWNCTIEHLTQVQAKKPYYEPYTKAFDGIWEREIGVTESLAKYSYHKAT